MEARKSNYKGRKPGSHNKSTVAAKAFVERVKAKLQKDKKLTFEAISVALLTCGIPSVVQAEKKMLVEYQYGKPVQPQEISGEGGGAVMTLINLIPRPIR